ncbi:MAG: type II/IV secretion system ATPase subunit [Nitrososphaeria archaeon]
MNRQRRTVIFSLFSKEPEDRFKEQLHSQSAGNKIRLIHEILDKELRILDSYYLEIGREYRPKIFVGEMNGQGYYFVEEPRLDEGDRDYLNAILGYLITSLNAEDFSRENYMEFLERKIQDICRQININVDERKAVLFSEIIAREAFGYGLIDPLMSDDNLTDISCSSYKQPVYVRHREYSEYNWMTTNITCTEEELDSITQKMASRYGRGVNVLTPYLEIITGEGHRIMLTYKTEISLPSSTFSIRKFPAQPWSIAKIIANSTISEDVASYLWHLLENRQFVIISGPMSSGKTTLLSTLLQLIHPSSKILTIEDTPEISIGERPNWQRLITRKTGARPDQDIGLMELAMLSLRTSSDYIALGEVRGSEIQALVQAAGTGLGCITTFHAGNFEELASRMKGKPLSVEESFLQTIKCVVFLSNVKLDDGKLVKRVKAVEEPYFDGGKILSNTIFGAYPEQGESNIDSILQKSRILNIIHESDTEAQDELYEKREFLKSVVAQKIFTFDQLYPTLSRFYGGRLGT